MSECKLRKWEVTKKAGVFSKAFCGKEDEKRIIEAEGIIPRYGVTYFYVGDDLVDMASYDSIRRLPDDKPEPPGE